MYVPESDAARRNNGCALKHVLQVQCSVNSAAFFLPGHVILRSGVHDNLKVLASGYLRLCEASSSCNMINTENIVIVVVVVVVVVDNLIWLAKVITNVIIAIQY